MKTYDLPTLHQMEEQRHKFALHVWIKYLMKIGLYRKFFDNCADSDYHNSLRGAYFTDDTFRYDKTKTYRECFQVYAKRMKDFVGTDLFNTEPGFAVLHSSCTFYFHYYNFKTSLPDPIIIRDKKITNWITFYRTFEEDMRNIEEMIFLKTFF